MKSDQSLLRALWRLLRPTQWIKNTVIFAVPVFGLALDLNIYIDTGVAFLLFCITASGVYAVNDIIDRRWDQQNPLKQSRPVAAGDISIPLASVTAVFLLLSGLLIGFWFDPLLCTILFAYISIQLAYSFWLKNFPIIDLLIISAGYVLRILSGDVTSGIQASSWLLLATGLLALFLGIEKRKSELQQSPTGETRQVLNLYSASFLEKMETVVTAATLIVYSLWALEGARSDWMLLTVPLVIYGIFRYQLLTERDQSGQEPVHLLIRSPSLWSAVLLWIVMCVILLLVTT